MKDSTVYIEDKAFDNTIVEDLDMESIRSGVEHGNMYLIYQFETIRNIRDNCKMLLSWLIGALIALTGWIGVEATSDSPNGSVLIVAGYELIFISVIIGILAFGALFRRTIHLPGDSPSHFFQDVIINPLKGFNDKAKYIIGWHLYEIQLRITKNEIEQTHEVRIYRTALILSFIAAFSGALLFIVLLLFRF